MRSEAFLESSSAFVSETKKDQPDSAIREWIFAAAHGTMVAERREVRGMYFEYGETAVSYTHLDVYKRQRQNGFGVHCAERILHPLPDDRRRFCGDLLADDGMHDG